MLTLVTGANGFVGSALCDKLWKEAIPVRGTVRKLTNVRYQYDCIAVGGVSSDTDWSLALNNVQRVVHLASRVHILQDSNSEPLSEFRSVNVQGTVRLARQAAAAGVKRFVFVSSVKVHGEFTKPGLPFTAASPTMPEDPYGISKLEAEHELRHIAANSDMEVVIIRPPLVYGPGVKANFEVMMRWLARGIPLPLAAINRNQRSFLALDNLIDLILLCLHHPHAAHQTFVASDGEDLSTVDLLTRMGTAMGCPVRLFYVPPALLKMGTAMFNRTSYYQRLCESLQIDISQTQQRLRWVPPISVDEGLRRTAEKFIQ